MKKLTKREKLLLYILGCFLIAVFGFYFVIMPSMASYQVVSDQVSEAQFTKDSMAMAIDSIPTTMQARDQANSNLAMLKASYSPCLTNEGLDVLLTQFCLDYGLSPEVLSVQSNDLASVLTFVADTSGEQTGTTGGIQSTTTNTSANGTTSSNSAAGSSTTTGATTTSTAATKTTETAGGTETPVGVVNMELTGTWANFNRLLDAVATRPDIVITAFSIEPQTSTTTGSSAVASSTAATVTKLDGSSKLTVTVTFEVYMAKN